MPFTPRKRKKKPKNQELRNSTTSHNHISPFLKCLRNKHVSQFSLLGCLPLKIYLKIKLSSIWYCRCKTSPFPLKETTHWSCSCRGEALNDFCVIREPSEPEDQEQLSEWTAGLGIPSLCRLWSTLLSVLTWMNVNEKPSNFPTDTPNNRERISQGQASPCNTYGPASA